MRIAIRKEPNGLIYIHKNLLEGFDYTLPPYNFTLVEVPHADCEGVDFNEDLTFSLEKYVTRKQKELEEQYESKIVTEIRKRYSIDQELAILRQKETKIEEFAIYYAYVEDCKAKVKAELGV